MNSHTEIWIRGIMVGALLALRRTPDAIHETMCRGINDIIQDKVLKASGQTFGDAEEQNDAIDHLWREAEACVEALLK